MLHRPATGRDPVEIARVIAGAQAQDRYAARLSFRSRSKRPVAADIDRARTEERSLLRTWVMRKTIHLIPSDDAGWMLPLFEPLIEKWSRRRLGQLGLPASAQEKALRVIQRALDKNGPMTRSDAAAEVEKAGVELNPQTRLHIVMLATVSGIAIQGPDFGASPSLVLRRDWIRKQPRFVREQALPELARRYLRGFGPATDRDFAKWSGLGLGELRTGLEAIAGELTESRVGEEVLLSLQGAAPRLPRGGQLRLLGAFDTYLLGYSSRDFAVAQDHGRGINSRGGGMIEPVIVRDGELLGIWRMSRKDGGLEIALDPFEPLGRPELEAVEAEVADIGRFEGLEATLG
ncbi:MAG: winged helix DNA-binding domain-containing protein [Solirubrobacterales bacterium]